MIVTLCTNCNRPAPQYDEYQWLVQNLLVHIAAGVTIIRIISWDLAAKKTIPTVASDWVDSALDHIHEGNDLKEKLNQGSEEQALHSSCPEWKQMTRRMNTLLSDLDFMRQDLIGHFVPK